MGTSAFSSSTGGQALADINITPLVDVMLVLLMIFMVTMPIRSEPLDLTLPGVRPTTGAVPPEPVQLELLADGAVMLDGARMDFAELPQALRALHRQAPAAVLRLDAGDEVAYGRFAQALALARNTGYQNVAIRR